MKKIYIIITFISIIVLSCISEPKYSTPKGENIIPKDSLELLIYDIHLADAIITSKIMKTKDNKLVDSLLYVSVFEKHNYTREQFEQTLLYYVHNRMDTLNTIYDRVIDRFNLEKGEIY
ncbi:MAG: DUF4296 domain-containing protein [Bacteroidales bacterium]|nr:DUF4296 domain-containing protein [Bacteroidales bacterium]MDD3859899.1 DUF4296 domain-containing protein [Bacteroidales bacterium]